MKSLFTATAIVAALGFGAIPAFANYGTHPQVPATSSVTVLAQSSDQGATPSTSGEQPEQPSDQGNQSQDNND